MSDFKIAGCCTLCDEPCFRITEVNAPDERLPGEPKRLGPPNPGATRIVFMLLDGTCMNLTFCGNCAAMLPPGTLYVAIWRKVIRSWIRELSEKPVEERTPDWFKRQFENSILCEMSRTPWMEVVSG